MKSPVDARRTSAATKFALASSLLLAAACSSSKPKTVDGGGSTDAHTDTGPDVAVTHDAATKETGGTKDAGTKDAGPGCTFGQAASQATATDLNLFGTPEYFNNGQPIPAGSYRLTYVDGCMMYGPGQGWTVNAYANGSDGWWLVGATTSDKILVLPGTIRLRARRGRLLGLRQLRGGQPPGPPGDLHAHRRRPGHLWVARQPYTDNTAGENDRNPSWQASTASTAATAARATPRRHRRTVTSRGAYRRATESPANDCPTGINSIALTLTRAGNVATQQTASATSSRLRSWLGSRRRRHRGARVVAVEADARELGAADQPRVHDRHADLRPPQIGAQVQRELADEGLGRAVDVGARIRPARRGRPQIDDVPVIARHHPG